MSKNYNIQKVEGGVCAAQGFYADGIAAGLKPDGAKDMAFIYSDTLCDVASVLTTNKMAAAPIHHTRGVKKSDFILVNSKNANAMTGEWGLEDLEEILASVQREFPIIQAPLMSSTGVIGVRLPKEKLIEGAKQFDLTQTNSTGASQAIMTTDSFNKEIAFEVTLADGNVFHIGAIAKGAGMINPAMATMLCFITTDIKLEQTKMQTILERVNTTTFNAASVDGDTSTNDTVLLLSNQKSSASDAEAFEAALFLVMDFMARALVRDGEGSTKLVTYEIEGAKDDQEAELVAKTLSNSLLIKTALYGEDPNWGRIAMSVGASGAACDEKKLTIMYNDVTLYKEGVNLFDADVEAAAAKVMQQSEFSIKCNLGMGDGKFRSYGCDLGYEYVKINADYRT